MKHKYRVYGIPLDVENCCPDVVDNPIKCAICNTTIGWGGGDLNCTSFVCVGVGQHEKSGGHGGDPVRGTT